MSYVGIFKMAAVTMTSLSDRYENLPCDVVRPPPGAWTVACSLSSNSIALFVGAKAYKSNERNSSGSFALLQRQVRTTSGLFYIHGDSCRTTLLVCTKGDHYNFYCSCTARLNSLWHWRASLI